MVLAISLKRSRTCLPHAFAHSHIAATDCEHLAQQAGADQLVLSSLPSSLSGHGSASAKRSAL